MKKFNQVPITPQQEKLWTDTRTALLWHCPAFSHILYTMLDNTGSKHIAFFTDEVPIAATDGSSLLLNPETFFKYNLNERIFICAHEIAHCIFAHCETMFRFQMRGKVVLPDGTEYPYDQKLMNVAADLVINDLLIDAKVGSYNKDWLHDKKVGTKDDAVLDVYAKLFKKQPPNGGSGAANSSGSDGGKSGAGAPGTTGGKSFDEHLQPGAGQGQDPTQASNQRNETEWKTAIAGAVASAKAQGKLPAGLERFLDQILNPKVDWREKIQGFFARKAGGGSYNWRKPDRRLITRDIIAPGRSGYGAGPVVVAVDTSGSIGQKELDVFFGEIGGILEDVRPTCLYIFWCDAAVHRVDELDGGADLYGVRKAGAPGGGGTSFVPVFDKVDEMGIQPDCVVYLTDGMGTFPPKAPPYAVLWGSIYEPSKYPFGDVVDVPVK